MSSGSHQKKLLPRRLFLWRVLKYFLYSVALITISMLIGVFGYHYLCDLGWVDSFLNASMILTGMGPVNQMTSDTAKIFASFYALYSGVAFLTTVAIFLSPMVHRFLHFLRLEDDNNDSF